MERSLLQLQLPRLAQALALGLVGLEALEALVLLVEVEADLELLARLEVGMQDPSVNVQQQLVSDSLEFTCKLVWQCLH
jgi:hypothetical protein